MLQYQGPENCIFSSTRSPKTFFCFVCIVGVVLLLNINTLQTFFPADEINLIFGSNRRLSTETGTYRGNFLSGIWASNLPEQSWFSDPKCARYVTRFARDYTIDVVRLASFPRSGNTWTRYLLETSTGIFTGSGGPNYFNYLKTGGSFRRTPSQVWEFVNSVKAVELNHMGYLGETALWTQGTTIVEKSHNLPQPWNETEANETVYNWSPFPEGSLRRAIVLIRDPFKSFISLRKYGETHSVLSGGKSYDGLFVGADWEKFVTYYAQHWYNLNTAWVERTNDTLVINYESLQKTPIVQLEKMLDFLEVKADPGRMRCLSADLEGRVHNKKHGTVPDKILFPLHLRALVWSRIHQLNSDLIEYGHQNLPLEKFSFADEFARIS